MRNPLLLATLVLAAPAFADEGIPVSVKVTDVDGNPISSAVVRHPQEKERHRVNMETGVWTGDAVYLEDGTEIIFDKKLELTFEVSAPGFQNESITYVVRKRKNLAVVQLTKLDIATDPTGDEDEGPIIGFKHDNPRD